ncbi:MAG TPA: M1 family aminopeptidase [Puia sp.]
MRTVLFLIGAFISLLSVHAQDSSKKNISEYRATATKLHDLIHTKLEIKLDYDKAWLLGKAWITLKPHFYSTDSLLLDAQGMDIHQIALFSKSGLQPLRFVYDGMVLKIFLDRFYSNREPYTVYIDYTAKPNDLKAAGSTAIIEARGLYFINQKGTEKNKPIEVWTQGESQSNSAWFPTIDRPNQKTTEEIILTVPSKYVSLSNGISVSSKENGNGTRTDYWKMDLPHAPYLFFFGVGDYAVVKDHYKEKEVNYYVEKEYEPVARRIFGLTPRMMAFYSKILGVEFPWPKYAQMTARDYVSGAMENTTATLHSSTFQQNARELTEGNRAERVVAHELFHHWFGDLVTAESWSNITLNESFARFGEFIWTTYKDGREAGDAVMYDQMKQYLNDSAAAYKDLVRFYYEKREDVFDFVSYNKGGLILNMLKNYLGDSAFYQSLHLYLVTNQFKSAEAQDLRRAFEKVTGQDLNWYWNQWYYGSGHPVFGIRYAYDNAAAHATVIVKQTQQTGKIFRIPLAIDVYEGDVKTRHMVWIQNVADTFVFSYKTRPSLINVDGDKMVVCEKHDDKSLENYIFQYHHAGLYADKMEAVLYCAKHQADAEARKLLLRALTDPFYKVREAALDALGYKADTALSYLVPTLEIIATGDSNKIVRSLAIRFLGSFKNEKYKSDFLKASTDSSYSVAGRGLEALALIDSSSAMETARKLEREEPRGMLSIAVQSVLDDFGNEGDAALLFDNYENMDMASKTLTSVAYIKYLVKVKDNGQLKKAVDQIVGFREKNRRNSRQVHSSIDRALKELADQKAAEGLTEQAEYIRGQLIYAPPVEPMR